MTWESVSGLGGHGHFGADLETGGEMESRSASAAERHNRLQAAMRELMGSIPIALTPSAVLQMLQHRLNGLDNRIGQCMAALNDNTALAEREQRILGLLQELKGAGNSEGGDGVCASEMEAGRFEEITAELAELGVTLADAPGATDRTRGQRVISGETLQAAIDQHTGELRGINSGNEMMMIELQSATQQRQAEVQLASSIIKILQETTDSVISNMR